MFLEYYGLNEQPFGVTPDPRFLYLGTKHLHALSALTYGTESNRGFLTLIAKPGMGKTLWFSAPGSNGGLGIRVNTSRPARIAWMPGPVYGSTSVRALTVLGAHSS